MTGEAGEGEGEELEEERWGCGRGGRGGREGREGRSMTSVGKGAAVHWKMTREGEGEGEGRPDMGGAASMMEGEARGASCWEAEAGEEVLGFGGGGDEAGEEFEERPLDLGHAVAAFADVAVVKNYFWLLQTAEEEQCPHQLLRHSHPGETRR